MGLAYAESVSSVSGKEKPNVVRVRITLAGGTGVKLLKLKLQGPTFTKDLYNSTFNFLFLIGIIFFFCNLKTAPTKLPLVAWHYKIKPR